MGGAQGKGLLRGSVGVTGSGSTFATSFYGHIAPALLDIIPSSGMRSVRLRLFISPAVLKAVRTV